MQSHPAAEIFPLMCGAEFDGLVADIRDHGQREAIVVHEGMILDGRNRFRACQQLGLVPLTVEWDKNGGRPETFVVSMNVHRRHLSTGQRAMIAAEMATRTREESLIPGGGTAQKVDLLIRTTSLSIPQAAELLHVGSDTVASAKTVLTKGTPEQIAAVRSGEAAVSTVAKQIRKGQPSPQRKNKKDLPRAQTGKNVERIQRMQMQAELWKCVSAALLGLTSLPLPSDVVEVIAANAQRTRVVDDRLSRSLQYLKDFDHAWRNRNHG